MSDTSFFGYISVCIGIVFVLLTLYVFLSGVKFGVEVREFCSGVFPSSLDKSVYDSPLFHTEYVGVDALEKGYVSCCRRYINANHELSSECKAFKYKKKGGE